jgi:polysaccharide pyruvyl transferase WcaK-like protein
MDKFLLGWEGYARQIEHVDARKGPKHIRQAITKDAELMDQVIKEKFNQEQQASLNEFRNLIYETEQKKRSDTSGGTPDCGYKGTGGCH